MLRTIGFATAALVLGFGVASAQIAGSRTQADTRCDSAGNCTTTRTTTYDRAPEPATPYRVGPGSREDIVVTIPKGTRTAAGPIASDLCPKPYRMTEMDGCQLPRR